MRGYNLPLTEQSTWLAECCIKFSFHSVSPFTVGLLWDLCTLQMWAGLQYF
jgi:hypothetical protein